MLGHTGQMEAWASGTRKLIILAGWQSGKTDFLVWWCLRQIKRRGPGDAIAAAPTYPLLSVALQKRLVDEIENRGIGEHRKGDNYIHVPYESIIKCGYEGERRGDLRIWLRHTSDAKAVEAATAQWFAGDEAGQMADEVLEAIDGRTSATGGEVCLISRPYFDNKFRQLCDNPDKETTVVSFASWDNPGWRKDLVTREAKKAYVDAMDMADWRKAMKYGGKFTRPAGAIYDCFEDKPFAEGGHLVAPFIVPPDWERVYGIDFGPVHTAVSCYAKHPEWKSADGLPVWVNYRTYFPNVARDVWQHVDLLRRWEQDDYDQWLAQGGWRRNQGGPQWPVTAFGGAPSENKTREAWTNAGLPVFEPLVSEFAAGVDAVYSAIRLKRVVYFDTLKQAIKETLRYSWKTNLDGDPLPGEKPEDGASFHLCDAERYVAPVFAGSFVLRVGSRKLNSGG